MTSYCSFLQTTQRWARLCVLAGALGVLSCPAQAKVVAGINVSETVTLGESTLVLNGAGMRAVAMFRAYVVGLYLPRKGQDANAVIAMSGPKRLHLVLMRDLEGEDLGKAFERGVLDNLTQAEATTLSSRLATFDRAVKSLGEVPKGTVILLDYVPGQGTRFQVNGRAVGQVIPGEDFYRSLMLIWLGERPVGSYLKRELLGAQS
jgi:hypothetical protein